MGNIEQVQKEIINEFGVFDNWHDKYEHLIELGKSISLIFDKERTDDNLIRGCQSRVWIVAEFKNGRVIYRADSDAIITKGIVGLVLRAFSNRPPKEIIKADESFIDKIGLKEHLSPTRANGLVAMLKQIKLYAIAFNAKQNL